jgi:hypothetical protein
MKITGIKRSLLLVVSVLIYILLSLYLLNFVEPPADNIVLIIVFTPIFACFVGWVNNMIATLFDNWKKERQNRTTLRCRLDDLIKYPFNTSHEYYLRYSLNNNIQLVNLPKFPQKIEKKIMRYNKKAEDLTYLFRGCEHFVKDMIMKNALGRLHSIDVISDGENNVIQWELGNEGREGKLSELLSNVLKDRILKGDRIDKPLIDSIDPSFYDKVVRESGEDIFKYFLRDLNEEIEFQRRYGCLNLFTRTHEEAKKLVEDLQSDARVKK